MIISGWDAEDSIEREAKQARTRLKRAIEEAKNRKVKNPEKSQAVNLIRVEFQALLRAIAHIRMEKACSEVEPGDKVDTDIFWRTIQDELEMKWDEEYATDQMRRK